ncbi:MAG TPA: hypothetical protein DCE55_24050 [Planctomycetaceae bacterium]|nr:hypothetical protein [Planctomycetaceae bacterium]
MDNPASFRSRASWRGATSSNPGKRLWARVFAVLLLLGLLQAFGWLVWTNWPGRFPETHFVAITTGNAHRFAAPPIAFAGEDLRPLQETDLSSFHYHDFSQLQTSSQIGNLGRLVGSSGIGDRDTLIVFLSAHGISVDGQPCLIGRDYELNQSGQGRYPVSEVLAQLKQVTARTKLLVLDVGWILSDPRLGVTVNEFPRLLTRQLASWDDPQLWVLLSSSDLEVPFLSVADSATIFGRGFVTGLLGRANEEETGNRDGRVALHELYDCVSNHCRTETGGLQQPVLLRAGEGGVTLTGIPQNLHLAVALRSHTEAESTEEQVASAPVAGTASTPAASAADSGKGSGPQEDNPLLHADDVERQERGDPSTEEPAAATSDVPGPAAWEQVLRKAWIRRDQLEALQMQADQWSPVEFAPHLWREFNRLLVEVDLRSRSGDAFRSAADLQQAQQLVVELSQLLKQLQKSEAGMSQSTRRESVLTRLMVAGQAFLASPQRQTFVGPDTEFVALGMQLRQCQRISYRVADYVQWHNLLSTHWSVDVPLGLAQLADQIELLLLQLDRFRAELASRKNTRIQSRGQQDPLSNIARQMQQLQREIDQRVEEQIRFLESNAGRVQVQQSLFSLLASALPTAQQRRRLVEPLGTAPVNGEALAGKIGLRDLRRSCELRLRFLRSFRPAMPVDGASSSQHVVLGTEADFELLWDLYRSVGKTVAANLAELKNQLGNGGIPWLDVHWLDARDVVLLPASVTDTSFFTEFPFLPSYQLEIVQEPAGSLRFPEPDQQPIVRKIEFVVSTNEPNVAFAQAMIRYDTSQLLVDLADQKRSVSQAPVQIPLDSDGKGVVQLAVRFARQQSPNLASLSQTQLQIEVSAGQLRSQMSVECVRSQPDFVELVVQQKGAAETTSERRPDYLKLQPFPNRTSQFQFFLMNRSPADKSVSASLFAMPRSTGAGRSLLRSDGSGLEVARRTALDVDTGQIRPQLKLLAQTKGKVPLPADGAPHRIPWQFPAGAVQTAADATSPPPAEDAVASGTAVQAEVEVSSGLLLVVRAEGKQWLKWIDVHPMRPHEYLQTHVDYNADQKQVRIEVRPLDRDGDGKADRFPDQKQLSEHPIEVEWDVRQLREIILERNDHAQITQPGEHAVLTARVKSADKKRHSIQLHVDGCPRAFSYELTFDRDNRGQDRRRDARFVQMRSVRVAGGNRQYQAALLRSGQDGVEGEKKNPQEIRRLRPGEPVYFAVQEDVNRVLIGLEVDAPQDAFVSLRQRDRVAVGVVREGFAMREWYTDRSQHVWVSQIGPAGVAIRTRISDFVGADNVAIDLQGLKNTRVRLRASLQLAATSTALHDDVLVVLDDAAPEIRNLTEESQLQVQQGELIPIRFVITDISGPEKIEIGVIQQEAMPLGEKKKVRSGFAAQSFNNQWRVFERLPSAGLQPGGYFVKAIVTDHVGKQATSIWPIRVVPLRGTLRGIVRFGNSKPSGILVEVLQKDKVLKFTKTAVGGTFSFSDLPGGEYSLRAVGAPQNSRKTGALKVNLEVLEDFQSTYEIVLR